MSKPFLTLDVGSSTIKLAEFTVTRSGGLQLLRYAAAPIPDPYDEESRPARITGTILELLQSTGMAPGKVLMTVSGQQVFTRYVHLPKLDEKKLEQNVRYEVQQNVPIPIDQVVWDYQLLPSASAETDVLLVAIKKELLDSLVASVTDAGLEPELIDVAPLALSNSVNHNHPGIEGCALVVDMGARATNLIFIEAGRVYNRSIPVAGNTITQQIMKDFDLDYESAEALKNENAQVSFGGAYEALPDENQDKVARCVRSIMTRMHAEISRSIHFYRGQQSGTQPTRILLTGGTSLIPYVDAFLKEKLGVEVEYLNPFAHVSVAPDISEEDITRDSHMLAELVGLALRKTGSAAMQVDLLPGEIIEARAAQRKQPVILAALGLLCAASGLWLFSAWKGKSAAESRLADITGQVEAFSGFDRQIKGKLQEVEMLKEKAGVYFSLKQDRARWLVVLESLREGIPAGAWITSITLAESKAAPAAPSENDDSSRSRRGEQEEAAPVVVHSLNVQGLIYEDQFATNTGAVQQYVDRLKANPLFSAKTNLKTAPVRMPGRDTVRMFWIEVGLKDALPR